MQEGNSIAKKKQNKSWAEDHSDPDTKSPIRLENCSNWHEEPKHLCLY